MPRLKKIVIENIKLSLVNGKLSNNEIADKFSVSIRTIQYYRKGLGLNNKRGRPFND